MPTDVKSIADGLEAYADSLRQGDEPKRVICELAEWIVALIREYEIEWQVCFPKK